MNGKKARALRRMAKDEMAGCIDRELLIARVNGHDRIVNEPLSVRAMDKQLKKAYKRAQRA